MFIELLNEPTLYLGVELPVHERQSGNEQEGELVSELDPVQQAALASCLLYCDFQETLGRREWEGREGATGVETWLRAGAVGRPGAHGQQ